MKRGISLKSKFFLTSLISGAVIVAVTIAVSANLSVGASVAQAQESLDSIAQTNVRLLSQFVHDKEAQLELVSGTRLVRDFLSNPTAQNRTLLFTYLQKQVKNSDDLDNFSLLDPETGVLLLDAKGSASFGTNLTDAAFWAHRGDDQPFADPMVVRDTNKTLLTFFSAPARDDKGQAAALLVMSVDWSKYSAKEFAVAKIGETGYVVVFGANGLQFYNPNASMILSTDKITDAARIASEKKNIFQRYQLNGDWKYMYAHEVPENGWIVAATVKEVELIQSTLQSVTVTVILGVVLLIITAFVSYFVARGVSKPVMSFVAELSEASSQIGLSSGQLSQASQEIANGATEQASQIEETSASMEELASMVKQNVENAKQASALAGRSADSSKQGAQEMAKMSLAMEEIGRSADEIRGVIDVIEDISFQTNMLALNAAVEAARAGEAGLGFAVVADEVKNLANRSSASAKETAAMIKEANRKIANGVDASKRLTEIFQGILGDSAQVGEVTREVEAASQQQDEGISQVNQAIAQFDSVVQNNASSSEETASAAEELQSQVQTLETIVKRLYLLVTGKEFTAVPRLDAETPRQAPAVAGGKQRISFESDEEFARS
jgi:methyl-accepting chemotaxis protein